MMTVIRNLVVLSSVVLLSACGVKPIYTEYHDLPKAGWHMDSLEHFAWAIEDTTKVYDVIVYLRHTERYPYQNMWFFMNNEQDTMEFYVADNRGRWLGNNVNGFIETSVLVEESYCFDSIGTYQLDIRHGMRDTLLRGVMAIGVEVYGKE